MEGQLGPAQLDPVDPGQAERAIEATLATLGELVGGREAADLASQLPDPFKIPIGLKSEEGGESFSLGEFYRRVAQKEDVEIATASIHAAAVMKALERAISGGELEEIRAQLPEEYAPLFSGTESG